MALRILVLDNFDSFTYNLVQLFQTAGAECLVFRNTVSFDQVLRLKADAVVISPGPGTVEKPKDFGVCARVIQKFEKPILGVCLGHQGIAYAYGAKIVRTTPVHGKTSTIQHNGTGLFAGVKNPLQVARYHSLVVDPASVPDVLTVTARTVDGQIMALQHTEKPQFGVQFHPESFITENGRQMADNFLKLI